MESGVSPVRYLPPRPATVDTGEAPRAADPPSQALQRGVEFVIVALVPGGGSLSMGRRRFRSRPVDKNRRNRKTMPNTIRLHRVLRASPEKVYRAFLDADAMTKWLPPNGFTGKVHHMDAKVGGSFKMSFTNFSSGSSISFGGEYLELLPHERIRYTDRFDDPNLPGVIKVTVVLKQVSCGTDVSITQEGVPDVIPVEACYLGWQESLTLLSQLVEVELPG